MVFYQGVSEIVDHHKDLGSYPWVKGSQRVIAFAVEDGSNDGKALVASACSLVVEKVREKRVWNIVQGWEER